MYKLLLIFILGLGSLTADTALVSINPYKGIVQRIAGNTLDVALLVPPAADMHNFEPTPRQMVEASQATVWFRVGEGFENKALKALTSYQPKMLIVDLRDGVDLITASCCHKHISTDIHFWLSPQIVKEQAKKIAAVLTKLYPENGPLYEKNLASLEKDLDALDKEIKQTLAPLKDRVIFVSHPSYAYYGRDYQITQFPIEFEGKDPSPKQLTKVLEKGRELKVKTVFAEIQLNNKGAELIADELGAKLVLLNTFSDDYLEMMRQITQRFAQK